MNTTTNYLFLLTMQAEIRDKDRSITM